MMDLHDRGLATAATQQQTIAALVAALKAANETIFWYKAQNFEFAGRRIKDIIQDALDKAEEGKSQNGS